jgi:hypothetical protein
VREQLSYPENDNETEASRRSRLALEAIVDEETFVDFLEALSADWADERAREAVSPSNPYGPGANGWENTAFSDILEATVACWRDNRRMGGSPVDETTGNAWRAAATIIYHGKYYE